MDLNDALALADACMSATSLACVLLGYAAIRARRLERHRKFMLAAVATSGAFMALFATRFALFGFEPSHARGGWRGAYLLLLLTHEPLAVINVPLTLAALVLGLRGARDAHRDVARVALPVWLYVLSTGLALYVVLYVYPG